jgi:hypothetical protein
LIRGVPTSLAVVKTAGVEEEGARAEAGEERARRQEWLGARNVRIDFTVMIHYIRTQKQPPPPVVSVSCLGYRLFWSQKPKPSSMQSQGLEYVMAGD